MHAMFAMFAMCARIVYTRVDQQSSTNWKEGSTCTLLSLVLTVYTFVKILFFLMARSLSRARGRMDGGREAQVDSSLKQYIFQIIT